MNEQSRESNSIRNVLVGVTNQVLFLVLNLVAKIILINTLGELFLGINGLFNNIFLVFSFAEFGIGSAMIYSLYKPIANKDKNKIAALYQFYRKIYTIMAIVVLVLGIALIPVLDNIVNTKEPVENILTYYLIYLVNAFIYNLFIFRSYLITADQKNYIVNLTQIIFDSLALISQIAILIFTQNYTLYLACILLKTIGNNLVIGHYVHKLYPFVKNKSQITKYEKKDIYRNVTDLFVYKFARVLLNGTDNIIISVVVGTIWVGYYSNYDLIIAGVISIVSMFYGSLAASVGNLIVEKQDDSEGQYRIFKIIETMNFWISGFTTTCLFVLFQDFIQLCFGVRFLFSYEIVAIVVFNFYLKCTRDSTKMFREAAGLFSKIKYIMCCTAVLNLILSVILGKIWGVFGVFMGTAISTLATYYWYEPKALFKYHFKKSSIPYFFNQLKSFIFMLISVFITMLCTSFITQVTIPYFILKIVICMVVPNLFYCIILWRTKEFKYLLALAKRMLGKAD